MGYVKAHLVEPEEARGASLNVSLVGDTLDERVRVSAN